MKTGVVGGGREESMATNMNACDFPKKENRNRRGRFWLSGQVRLDRRMQEVFARIEGPDGTVPSRGVYKIRAGEQHPWRVLFRRLVELKDADVSDEQIDDVVRDMLAAIKDELTRRRGAGRIA